MTSVHLALMGWKTFISLVKNQGSGVTNLSHLSCITFPPASTLHKTRRVGERKVTRHQTGAAFRMRGQITASLWPVVAVGMEVECFVWACDVRLGLERIRPWNNARQLRPDNPAPGALVAVRERPWYPRDGTGFHVDLTRNPRKPPQRLALLTGAIRTG